VYLSPKVQLATLIVFALSSIAVSQTEQVGTFSLSTTTTTTCAPPTYGCARTDLIKTNNLNPPPSMSKGKNTIVTPSDFKLPIARVTDSTTFQNRTITETPSGSDGDNIFSTDDSYFLVSDTGGSRYPMAFNPSTMKVLNTNQWNIGTNQVRWGGSSSFSRTTRNIVYAVPGSRTQIPGVIGNSTTLYKMTLSGTTSISATGTKMFDFVKCPGMPNPYNLGYGVWHSVLTVSAGDKRFSQAFSNKKGGQGTGTDVTVYDVSTHQCYRYDTAHARLCTATGCAPMSLPDEFTVHEVYMSLNGNYLRVTVGNCISGGCSQAPPGHPYFWEIGTTNVTRCYNGGGANCTGHMVEGYDHIYNDVGWPHSGKRSFTDPLSYTLVNSTPTLSPATDEHYSNNAADPYDTHPYWVTNVQNIHKAFGGAGCNTSGNIYLGCTFPGPLFGEIFGITQTGGYVRAAHSYNSGASPDFNCQNTIGAVSQSGKFFAWSSDWLTTLGKDNNNHNRCDVFIVNLAAAQGATN
jgi:hypothetical protein